MQPGIGSTGNATGDIMASNSPVALPLQQLLNLQAHGGGYNVPSEMNAIAPMAATSHWAADRVRSRQALATRLVIRLTATASSCTAVR